MPVSYADPPPGAPAHGWRKKHDPLYLAMPEKVASVITVC